jgi:hypothetical protein
VDDIELSVELGVLVSSMVVDVSKGEFVFRRLNWFRMRWYDWPRAEQTVLVLIWRDGRCRRCVKVEER